MVINVQDIADVLHFLDKVENTYPMLTNDMSFHTAKLLLQIMQNKINGITAYNKQQSNVVVDEQDDDSDTAAIMFD